MKQKFSNWQQGASLPIALILLVPLTLLGVTLANRVNLEEMMASSQLNGQQSIMNAETGLSMGQQALEKMVLDQIELKKTSPEAGLDVDSVIQLADPYTVLSYDGNALSGHSLAQGTVTVVVMDNDDGDSDVTTDSDGRVILRSIGNYGNYQGGERIVEAIVHMNFASNPAPETPAPNSDPPLTIFTEEWIDLNGNPDIFGPGSIVHSNAYVNIGGTTRIEGSIQQVNSGTGDSYSQVVDGGEWGDFQNTRVTTSATRVQTPYVYPPVYKGMATYYMTADCEVWNGVPGAISLVTGNNSVRIESNAKDNEWEGWKCDYSGDKNKKWELLGDKAITGFYYVEGNLIINGDPGTSSNPLKISIVAEGYLEVSGNPYITPYNPQGDFSTTPSVLALADIILSGNPQYNGINALDAVLQSDEILLMAGGDLNIQGNPASNFNFNGVIAAHDQFTISGNPRMSGAIIAENAKYTSKDFFFGNIDSGERKTDHITMNQISGEPDIYGEADLDNTVPASPDDSEPGDPAGANFKGWREVID
jgi:hypothetical protein